MEVKELSNKLLGNLSDVKTGTRNNQDKNADGIYPFYVRSDNVERINTFSYDSEAIMIPGEGNIGKIVHYVNGPHEVHQRVYRISNFSDEIYPKYLYWYLKQFFGHHAELNTVKATVDSLRLPTFLNFRVNYPDFSEQQAIAEALSDTDELIRTLKQEIEKKEILLRALSQRLIPWNFLTSLPTGWSLVTLGETGTITGAGVDKVFRNDEKEVTLINYMDVYRNDGLSKSLNYVKTSATAKQISNCSLRKADVLFTPTSETPEDIARSSVIIDDIPNAVYSYHLIRFRPSQAFDLNFLKHIFNIDDFRSQVRKSAEGSGTRYVITLPRFRSLVIPIPDLPTQSHIGSTLDETSSEIKKLKIELSKYECLKQGMMNDLLTGKVRLV